MTLFITSSPFVENAPRAILSPANAFIDNIRQALPENPRVLFVCADPEDHQGVCRFAAETTAAFAEAGIAFSCYHVLDGRNSRSTQALLNRSAPGLCRDLDLRTERFNQHETPGSLLVEVGASGGNGFVPNGELAAFRSDIFIHLLDEMALELAIARKAQLLVLCFT